jgi:hypothetical protein
MGMRWGGHVACRREMRNACRILVEKPTGNRPLGRPRGREEDNINIDLREMGYVGTDRMHQAQDRDHWRALMNKAVNFWFYKMLENFCVADLLAASQGVSLLVTPFRLTGLFCVYTEELS